MLPGRGKKARSAAKGPAGPAAKGRPPEPDAELFEWRGGGWRPRLVPGGLWAARPRAPRAGPAQLRAGLADPKMLEGASAVPDDLLMAAAMMGSTGNPAFLEVLDGEGFEPAPCLCCYRARNAAAARAAAAALRLFCRYYSEESYVGSRAYSRSVATLLRDLRPDEVAEVRAHVAGLASTPEAVREVNRGPLDLCVAAPPCQPGSLWVYSTPDGRRLLRHLARATRGAALPVKVTVASSDPGTFPRYHYRMYAAAYAAQGGQAAGAAAAAPDLLAVALAWAREQGRQEGAAPPDKKVRPAPSGPRR